MSVWTHVAGLIRIDSLPLAGLPYLHAEALERLFLMGVPGGSEGPLRVVAWKARPLPESVVWGYLAIDGDLRDFGAEDLPKIPAWLNDVCRIVFTPDNNAVLRQGVVQAEVEGAGAKVWAYDPEAEEWR